MEEKERQRQEESRIRREEIEHLKHQTELKAKLT
jgi:hypothetical protein